VELAMREGETVKTVWSWMPVLAAATGVILVTSGAPGTAWSAARTASGNGARVITQDPQQTVTDHSVSGYETSVSCLTASLCVAVGSQLPLPARSHGIVVTLTNGAQSHADVLRRSSLIDSVSCRNSGCWAVGSPVHGTGAYLVKISSAGRPVAERTVKLPAGTTLGPISCAGMRSCEIAGADNRIRPAAIEIGHWTGKKLHLLRITVKGSKRMSMPGISCWHSDCEAVGSALVGSARSGLVLTTARGKPARLNADSGYPYLESVSCISARTCYAVGGSGSAETVTRGVVTHSQGGAGGVLSAIECTASDCEAAGTILLPQYSTQDGLLQSLSDGTWGAPIDDGASYVFIGIAVRGGRGGFIAIGTGATAAGGSDVAVG
jgi:hypothetical protein